jgi:hypothetical protein
LYIGAPITTGIGGEKFVEHGAVGHAGQSEVLQRLGSEIAVDDLRFRSPGCDLLGDGAGQLPRDAVVPGDAAVDLQDSHNCLLSIVLLLRHSK